MNNMKREYKISPYKKDSWTYGGVFYVYAENEEEAIKAARLPKGWTATVEEV